MAEFSEVVLDKVVKTVSGEKMIDERIILRKHEIFSVFIGIGNIGRAAQALQMSLVSVHRALHSQGIESPLFVHQGRHFVQQQTA